MLTHLTHDNCHKREPCSSTTLTSCGTIQMGGMGVNSTFGALSASSWSSKPQRQPSRNRPEGGRGGWKKQCGGSSQGHMNSFV